MTVRRRPAAPTVEILRHAEDQETAASWLRKVAAGAVFGNAQSELNGAPFETTTKVESVDGQHLVSGTKFYSTGSQYADYIRVAVATVFDRVQVADYGELGNYKEDLRSLNSFVQLVHLAT